MLNINNNSKDDASNGAITSENKIVLYARISRLKSGGVQDVSISNQIASGRKYAQRNGFQIIGEFEEVQSAKKADNRPKFQAALALAKKEKAVLVLYSLSRGFRSTIDAITISGQLEKAGANLVSLSENVDTTTPHGRFFFSCLSAMAQMERELIGTRTKDALAHKKSKGEKLGGKIPFGFNVDAEGKLIPIKSEQKTISEMLRLRIEGMSYDRIANALNYKKIPAKNGGLWLANTVRRIMIEAKARSKASAAAV